VQFVNQGTGCHKLLFRLDQLLARRLYAKVVNPRLAASGAVVSVGHGFSFAVLSIINDSWWAHRTMFVSVNGCDPAYFAHSTTNAVAACFKTFVSAFAWASWRRMLPFVTVLL
jgi:hypothetical protein